MVLPAIRRLSKINPSAYRGLVFAATYPEGISSRVIKTAKLCTAPIGSNLQIISMHSYGQGSTRTRCALYKRHVHPMQASGTKSTPKNFRLDTMSNVDVGHEDISRSCSFMLPIISGLGKQTVFHGGPARCGWEVKESNSEGSKCYKLAFMGDLGYFRKFTPANARQHSIGESLEDAEVRMTDKPESFVTCTTVYNPVIHTTIQTPGSTAVPCTYSVW